MKRRTFDRIVSFVGLGLSVFLFVAAALLNWGASFANESVLMGQRTSLFMGETLRGLLLYSFAFWQIGQIAMYAAWAAAAGGLLMLILTLLGFAHLRRVEADATI